MIVLSWCRLLTSEELAAIRVCFLTRRNEELIRYGLVVKTRKFTRKLRYLLLTNYQLLYLESADVCKGTIDLARIQSVEVIGTSGFDVVVKGRTFHFYSSEPAAWVQARARHSDPLTYKRVVHSYRQFKKP